MQTALKGETHGISQQELLMKMSLQKSTCKLWNSLSPCFFFSCLTHLSIFGYISLKSIFFGTKSQLYMEGDISFWQTGHIWEEALFKHCGNVWEIHQVGMGLNGKAEEAESPMTGWRLGNFQLHWSGSCNAVLSYYSVELMTEQLVCLELPSSSCL